jgi:hypothetical protein
MTNQAHQFAQRVTAEGVAGSANTPLIQNPIGPVNECPKIVCVKNETHRIRTGAQPIGQSVL